MYAAALAGSATAAGAESRALWIQLVGGRVRSTAEEHHYCIAAVLLLNVYSEI